MMIDKLKYFMFRRSSDGRGIYWAIGTGIAFDVKWHDHAETLGLDGIED